MLTGVNVHSYISKIELRHSIIDTFEICVVSICALSDV